MTAVYETATQPEATGPRPRPLSYQPALDGVRAVALLLVVIFHLDLGILPAGYLGVSVFFTLSGFLITSLILDEWHASGALDVASFYRRRLKRLVPASVATLVGVAVLAAAGLVATTSRLRGDVIAAALNVFNWRELSSGQSYAQLFEQESPVAHFWSLAIEEQFYLVWPVVLLVALRLSRRRSVRAAVLSVCAVLFLAGAATAVLADPNVAYFATWTRSAEIMAGAMLAVWTATSTRSDWPRWFSVLAVPALLVIVALAALSSPGEGWAYQGGLVPFSLVSVALIAGLQVDGPARRALSAAPLVAIGTVSYGLYLVHWPVFVVLNAERVGVDSWALAAIRLAVTAAIGVAMYVALERPIRRSARPALPSRTALLALAAAAGVTLLAIVLIDRPVTAPIAPAVIAAPETPDAATSDLGSSGPDAPDLAIADDATSVAEPISEQPVDGTDVVAAIEPLRLAVFGDSVPAWLLRDAVASYDRSDVVVLNGAAEACDGMVDLPSGRDRRLDVLEPPPDCAEWPETYPNVIDVDGERAARALLVLGQAPVIDRLVDGEWMHPCTGIDWYLDDVEARIEFLRDAEVEPVVVLPARFGRGVTFIVPDDAQERVECVRVAMRDHAASLGVAVVDLDPILCPDDECNRFRSVDGIHVDAPFAADVLNRVIDATLDATAPT